MIQVSFISLLYFPLYFCDCCVEQICICKYSNSSISPASPGVPAAYTTGITSSSSAYHLRAVSLLTYLHVLTAVLILASHLALWLQPHQIAISQSVSFVAVEAIVQTKSSTSTAQLDRPASLSTTMLLARLQHTTCGACWLRMRLLSEVVVYVAQRSQTQELAYWCRAALQLYVEPLRNRYVECTMKLPHYARAERHVITSVM